MGLDRLAAIIGFCSLFVWAAPGAAGTVRWDFEEAGAAWEPAPTDPQTASVVIADDRAARGRQSLAIAGRFPGSMGATYYPWRDWRPYSSLRFQVFVPEGAPGDLDVYVYLKDKQYLWYQAAPFRAPDTGEASIPLKPGAWNRASLDISPTSRVWEAGSHLKSWNRSLYYPREFGIRFFSNQDWQGTLYVDDLRLTGSAEDGEPGLPVDEGEPALKLRRNAHVVPCHEKFELTFYLDRRYENPFDPEVVDVAGHFRAPSGQLLDVPGFYYQDYARMLDGQGNEKLSPVGEPCWKVRFSPTEPGKHEYFVTVNDERGRLRSATGSFTAEPPNDSRGRVRISKADPRYFEFENGDFYFPMGINMRDGGDQAAAQRGTYAFDEFLPAFRQAGLSFVRTWMSAWWASIEWSDKYDSRYDGVGRYCMYNAWRLDHALELAEEEDLFIELTLNSHGQLRRDRFDAEWEYNPYSAANGGPVATPSLFFLSPSAKDLFRQRYRYIAARWGYSQHIMSWDLWNEIDLIDAYPQLKGDVADWHREMAGYLRDVDLGRHLITTHYCLHFSWDAGRSLFQLPNIDYIQADAYWPSKHIADDMNRGYGLRANIEKPYIVIEYGPQTAGIEKKSRQEIEAFYRIGLWGSVVTPMASPAQFWYHDIWMRDAYARHNHALAQFLAGDDRRGQGWSWINSNPKNNPLRPTTTPAHLFVEAMTSPKATYFYGFDLARMVAGDAGRQASPYEGASVDLKRLPDGTYDCEFWDPYVGEVVHNAQVTVTEGNAHVVLPAFTQDVACKMRLRAP